MRPACHPITDISNVLPCKNLARSGCNPEFLQGPSLSLPRFSSITQPIISVNLTQTPRIFHSAAKPLSLLSTAHILSQSYPSAPKLTTSCKTLLSPLPLRNLQDLYCNLGQLRSPHHRVSLQTHNLAAQRVQTKNLGIQQHTPPCPSAPANSSLY
jgi:hypothetical protein